ncbi:hypothetical protein BsWGS_17404 [Bradybaena similaris]
MAAAVHCGRLAVLLFAIASSQKAGRPQHCTSSVWPEVAAAVPGDVIVRLCAFANPRPKLAAVSKGNKPDLNNLQLVNFQYTDATSKRGHFIFVIANATAADLGNYTLVAFANRTETRLNFRLVSSSQGDKDVKNEETTQASGSVGGEDKTIWIIVGVVPASLMLVVVLVVLVVLACKRSGRKGAKISGAGLLSSDVYSLQGHCELGPSEGTYERQYGAEGVFPLSNEVRLLTQDPSQSGRFDDRDKEFDHQTVKTEAIYEAPKQDPVYNNDIISINNDGGEYSRLDQASAANEQSEYFDFNDSSDQETYINIS